MISRAKRVIASCENSRQLATAEKYCGRVLLRIGEEKRQTVKEAFIRMIMAKAYELYGKKEMVA